MGKRRPTTPLPSSPPPTLHGVVPVAEVDLHGMSASQAERRVEAFLETWLRREPGAVLRIVTGKGNRSGAGPILLGTVEARLRQELGGRVADLTLDRGGGAWLVRLGGGRA